LREYALLVTQMVKPSKMTKMMTEPTQIAVKKNHPFLQLILGCLFYHTLKTAGIEDGNEGKMANSSARHENIRLDIRPRRPPIGRLFPFRLQNRSWSFPIEDLPVLTF
jgi:hypothetical protein